MFEKFRRAVEKAEKRSSEEILGLYKKEISNLRMAFRSGKIKDEEKLMTEFMRVWNYALSHPLVKSNPMVIERLNIDKEEELASATHVYEPPYVHPL